MPNVYASFSRYILLIVFMAGCSKVSIAEDGSTVITGLVNYKSGPTAAPETYAGSVTDVQQLGIVFFSTPDESGVGIGWQRLRHGFLRNNVEVIGPVGTPN